MKSTSDIQTGSPTKLRNGSWGVKVPGKVFSGEWVKVKTKSGKSWTSIVDKVVWTDGKVSICSISEDREDRYASYNRSRNSGYNYADENNNVDEDSDY